LWQDFVQLIRNTRSNEVGATWDSAKSITVDGTHTLKYYQRKIGQEPQGGRSLFIMMHGGGQTTPESNDRNWEGYKTWYQNYEIQDAVVIAARSPTNTWNMWFQDHVDPLFERLITDMIVFENINPNKIYLLGYSAGGDGAYRLGTRMADRWAGVSMGGGHQGRDTDDDRARPENLYNVAFDAFMGEKDTMHNRNDLVKVWGQRLEALQQKNPGAYPSQWRILEDKTHGDARPKMTTTTEQSVNATTTGTFLQRYTRNPMPQTVIWHQSDVTKSHFYWLTVNQANQKKNTQIAASYNGNTIELKDMKDLTAITLRVSDTFKDMDLDKVITVQSNGQQVYSGMARRTIGTMYRTLYERESPEFTFPSELTVQLN
jgi:poly(3-hydroxybutyrate) depolymerase